MELELIHRRVLNVDSAKLTDEGEVYVKCRDWGSRKEGDAMTVHFGMGMYGAPRVGDSLIVDISRAPSVPGGTPPSVEEEKIVDRAVMRGDAVRT